MIVSGVENYQTSKLGFEGVNQRNELLIPESQCDFFFLHLLASEPGLNFLIFRNWPITFTVFWGKRPFFLKKGGIGKS